MTVRAPDTTHLEAAAAAERAVTMGDPERVPQTPPGPAGARTAQALGSPGGVARRNTGDRVFTATVTALGAAVLAVPVLMLLALAWASRHAIAAFGVGFVTSSRWDPVHAQFGAWPFIWGTVVTSLLALVLAVPVSIGLAVFLSDLAPLRLRKPLGFVVELLAAIPSVVYGFWGIFVLVPFLRDHVEPFLGAHLGFLPLFRGEPLGFGMLAAGIILAIMIVPTITSISREVLSAVPDTHREAAIGLGATPWDVVRVAVLPAARSGVIGAIILGLNRALGETMAVTMVIGNRPKVSTSLLDPAYTMASVLANEFAEADSDAYLSALAEIALLLLGVALVMNLFARWLVNLTKQRIRGEAR
jgi:phosphate transport system permease protein